MLMAIYMIVCHAPVISRQDRSTMVINPTQYYWIIQIGQYPHARLGAVQNLCRQGGHGFSLDFSRSRFLLIGLIVVLDVYILITSLASQTLELYCSIFYYTCFFFLKLSVQMFPLLLGMATLSNFLDKGGTQKSYILV